MHEIEECLLGDNSLSAKIEIFQHLVDLALADFITQHPQIDHQRVRVKVPYFPKNITFALHIKESVDLFELSL